MRFSQETRKSLPSKNISILHQEKKEIFEFHAKSFEKDNEIFYYSNKENLNKIEELERNLKEFRQKNKGIFSNNCKLHKDLEAKDMNKRSLVDMEKEIRRTIENNKLKLIFFENKALLLETINKEAAKNITLLCEENEYFLIFFKPFFMFFFSFFL